MLAVEEALDRVLSRVTPVATERVHLLSALDRVLAEPVLAYLDIPPWPNSSMDGYAVRSEDVRHASRERPTVLRVAAMVPAGAVAPRPIAPGEAFRIFTGAPLPQGADGVIPQEEVERDGPVVRVPRPVAPGEYVRPAGEDMRAGEVVLEPGHLVGPAEVGLLATLGYAQLRIFRRPRVAILSTGDELVDLGGGLGPGKIPNSNTYALMAQVAAAGGEPVNLGVAADSLPAIEERLRWGLNADLLISSAGVSVGEFDFVKEALRRLGAELHLWQVALRPGKPITFGSLGPRLVFGLPGNPVSAMVTFELFVRPALRKMAGHRTLFRPTIQARALDPIPNPGRRRGYLRVTLAPLDGGYGARLTGEQGSAIVRSMVLADGLAVVPPETTIPAGSEVTVIKLK